MSVLSLTGDAESPLAQRSQLALTSAVPPELETLGMLPTRSGRVKVPFLAVPQLGSCASSGRAWRLWLPRVLELAALRTAHSPAFDHAGAACSRSITSSTRCSASAQRGES